MARRIEVVEYDDGWRELFREEERRLDAMLKDCLIAVHHIGSTAVPGLASKPIVDVLVEVDDIARVDAMTDMICGRGYIAKGAFGIEGRRFFIRGTEDRRSHHIHVFASDDPHIREHLIFRDYLIAHPGEAERYAALKRRAAKDHPADIIGYMAAKNVFIKSLLAQARVWRDGVDRVLAKRDADSPGNDR